MTTGLAYQPPKGATCAFGRPVPVDRWRCYQTEAL